MGNITIQSVVVQAKTAAIKKNIQSDILADNKSKITKMNQSMKGSKGDNLTALKVQLKKEENLINGLGDVLTDLVEYIDMVCTDFDQLDRNYAAKKIQ